MSEPIRRRHARNRARARQRTDRTAHGSILTAGSRPSDPTMNH